MKNIMNGDQIMFRHQKQNLINIIKLFIKILTRVITMFITLLISIIFIMMIYNVIISMIGSSYSSHINNNLNTTIKIVNDDDESTDEDIIHEKEIETDETINSTDNDINITVEETEPTMEEYQPTVSEIINMNLNSTWFEVNGNSLKKYALPSYCYPDLDFSSFQPWMDYRCITDKSSAAYALVNSSETYVDDNGLLRHVTTEDQLAIDGKDDYVVALGTFYKTKNIIGERFLVITSTGMYTCITGDEKDDYDTDPMNMYSYHNGKGGMIEWIVSDDQLNSSIKRMGTVTAGPVVELQGEILYIYKIN